MKWRLQERIQGPWPIGPVLWLHGASLGECRMLLGLIRALRSVAGMDGCVLLTTQKAEIMDFLRTQAPQNCFVHMAPLDFFHVREMFWARVRPWALVLGENEFWPGWMRTARAKGTPVALVSGRYRRAFPGLDWSALSYAALQTHDDWDRLKRDAGHTGVEMRVGGDWKSLDSALAEQYPKSLVRDIGLLLLSVHKEEWHGLLPMIHAAYERGEVIVLVPRRLEDVNAFKHRLKRIGKRILLWPEFTPGSVSIVDCFGLVSTLVARSKVAFVGGSFCRVGIHDFWEPLRAGCEVWVGERLTPHRELLHEMIELGVVGVVKRGAARPHSFLYDPTIVFSFLKNYYEGIRSSFEKFHTWLEGLAGATFRK